MKLQKKMKKRAAAPFSAAKMGIAMLGAAMLLTVTGISPATETCLASTIAPASAAEPASTTVSVSAAEPASATAPASAAEPTSATAPASAADSTQLASGTLGSSVTVSISSTNAASGSSSVSTLSANGKNSLETDDLSIDFTFGINGNTREGSQLPVQVKITMTEDFEGTMRFIIPGTYGYYTGAETTAYEKDITLTAGTEKTIEFCLNNNSDSTYCYFQLEDEKGEMLLDELLSMNTTGNENALVGILSSDYTAVNYFDRADISTENYADSASIQELTADSLPSSQEGLGALSYLVINSFDTSVLSAEQKQAVLGWVDKGGILILGGGADYKQTISGFADALSVKVGSSVEGSMKIQNQISETLNFTASDGFYDMQMENGSPLTNVLSDDNLIWAESYGSGRIVMTAFNLGMEPVSSWNYRKNLAAQILSAAASGDYSLRLSQINYGESYDGNYSTDLKGLFKTTEINNRIVMGILLAFIGFCTAVWLILKKMDRQMLFWAAIPAGAVLFSALLFLCTWNVRIRKPLTASVTIINENDNGTEEKISMVVLTPKPIWYELNFAEGITSVTPISVYEYDFLSDLKNESNGAEDYTMVFREDAEGYKVKVKNSEAFSTQYLSLTGNNTSGINGLETVYNRTTRGLSGTVTNRTGHTLKAVYVVTGDSYLCLGDLADGESKDFNDKAMLQNVDLYELASLNEYENGGDQETAEDISAVYETVYINYLSEYEYSSTNDCCTFGYVDGYEADYLADSSIRENNTAVILKTDNVGYSDYNNAYSYSLFDYASSDDDAWDPNDGEMYSLEAETTIDLENIVDHIYLIKKPDSEYYGDTSHTIIYAWNYSTGDWDEILTNSDTLEFSNGNCPYLQDHIMRMKFTCQYEDSDYVPRLTMIGGKD